MMPKGAINGWRCDGKGHRAGEDRAPKCGRITYAIHVDEGVTPMFLACRAEGVEPDDAECKGMGTSLMYPSAPPPDDVLDAVAWEWYAPDDREKKAMDAAVRAHVENGGLLLRQLTDEGRGLIAAIKETR